MRELNSVRGLTDALRAQQHEYDNRVHALAGLIELGRYEEAAKYAGELSSIQPGLAERLQERLDSPQVVGLLVAKSVVAAERGVTLTLSDDSALSEGDCDPAALLTIVGNLVDNAIDAAVGGDAHAVQVTIRAEPGGQVTVQVRDTGVGIPPEDWPRIFTDGFTTKPAIGIRRRGLGLALVQRTVTGAGGAIRLTADPLVPGMTFTVSLPVRGLVTQATP
ncbi:MAG: ATP-binding protein [Nakamurella sp.]